VAAVAPDVLEEDTLFVVLHTTPPPNEKLGHRFPPQVNRSPRFRQHARSLQLLPDTVGRQARPRHSRSASCNHPCHRLTTRVAGKTGSLQKEVGVSQITAAPSSSPHSTSMYRSPNN